MRTVTSGSDSPGGGSAPAPAARRICQPTATRRRAAADPAATRAARCRVCRVSSEAIWDRRCVQRQPVLVGIGVVVWPRWAVDEHHLGLADVLDRVPHAGWDAEQAAPLIGEVVLVD